MYMLYLVEVEKAVLGNHVWPGAGETNRHGYCLLRNTFIFSLLSIYLRQGGTGGEDGPGGNVCLHFILTY